MFPVVVPVLQKYVTVTRGWILRQWNLANGCTITFGPNEHGDHLVASTAPHMWLDQPFATPFEDIVKFNKFVKEPMAPYHGYVPNALERSYNKYSVYDVRGLVSSAYVEDEHGVRHHWLYLPWPLSDMALLWHYRELRAKYKRIHSYARHKRNLRRKLRMGGR